MQNLKSTIGSGSCMILTAIQTNQLFQYISLGLTIFVSILTIISWFRTALKDRNIDAEEIAELERKLQEAEDKINRLNK